MALSLPIISPKFCPEFRMRVFWICCSTIVLKQATKLTSTILVAQIRKPPDICQIHSKSDDWQQKVSLLSPSFPVLIFVFFTVQILDFVIHHWAQCPVIRNRLFYSNRLRSVMTVYIVVCHELGVYARYTFHLSGHGRKRCWSYSVPNKWFFLRIHSSVKSPVGVSCAMRSSLCICWLVSLFHDKHVVEKCHRFIQVFLPVKNMSNVAQVLPRELLSFREQWKISLPNMSVSACRQWIRWLYFQAVWNLFIKCKFSKHHLQNKSKGILSSSHSLLHAVGVHNLQWNIVLIWFA